MGRCNSIATQEQNSQLWSLHITRARKDRGRSLELLTSNPYQILRLSFTAPYFNYPCY